MENDNKKLGANAGDIQAANRSIILQILSERQICTRTELAKLTGLTKAAITINVNALIERGVIRETGFQLENGRRSVSLSLCHDKYKVIAAKLSRSHFAVGLYDISGRLYDVYREPVSSSAVSTFRRFTTAIARTRAQREDVYAIGVAVPGPYLMKEGRIALLTDFSGWSDINVAGDLQSRFDVPVYVEHDANAAALATWLYAEKETREGLLVCLVITEGVGAGIVDGGRILTGHNGNAGQIGHVSIDMLGPRCQCGNTGCLELYCSTRAVEQMAMHGLSAYPDSVLNQRDTAVDYNAVIEGVHAGDAFCIKTIEHLGFYIGCGIVTIINTYDPHTIAIQSDLNRCGEFLFNAVRRTVAERTLPEMNRHLRLVFSDPEKDFFMLGAAAVATNALLQNPNLIL